MAENVTEKDGVLTIESKGGRVAAKLIGGVGPYEPEAEAHRAENREAHEQAIAGPTGDFRLRIRESVMALSAARKEARTVEVTVRKGSSARSVREAVKAEMSAPRFRESSFDTGSDPTAGFVGDNPEQEFLQILGGPYSKQQYLSAFLEGQAKAFWELHHNPIARAYVSTFTDAIVGRGVKFKAKDPAFQKVWDEWAKRDKFERRLRWTAHDLAWQGEIFWRVFLDEKGRVTVRLFDPSTIWEVISEPSDVEIVHGYWQQYPGPWNIYTMLVNGKPVPQTEYIIRLIPAADAIHVKVNEAYGEKRGRSDFYPALSWFKRFRDYMAARITSAQYERAFVWDVEVDGDQADVNAALTDPTVTKVPKPGSAFWHNKAIKLTPMSAKVGGQGDAPSGTALDLIRTICAAIGMPVEYVGWGDSSTKANAITATAPWPVRVQQRQRTIETDLLVPFLEKLWTICKAMGQDVGETFEGEFTWPEPVREDIDARLKRLAYLVETGVLTQEDYATMAAGEANITNYDYATKKAAIDAERAARQAAGDAALDRAANATAAARLEKDRSLGPTDRSSTTDAARSMKPSQPVEGANDGDDADGA